MRGLLKDRSHHATLNTYGCAGCRGSEGTAKIDNHARDFVGGRKSFQKRCGTNSLEEFCFEGSNILENAVELAPSADHRITVTMTVNPL